MMVCTSVTDSCPDGRTGIGAAAAGPVHPPIVPIVRVARPTATVNLRNNANELTRLTLGFADLENALLRVNGNPAKIAEAHLLSSKVLRRGVNSDMLIHLGALFSRFVI